MSDLDRRHAIGAMGARALRFGVALFGEADVSRAQGRLPAGLDPLLAGVLHDASLAPSVHNLQPWAVRLTGPMRLEISVDAARVPTELDPDHRETHLSVGAFLENLDRSARRHALRADATLDESEDEPLLRVRLAPDAPSREAIAPMRLRCTLRAPFLTEALADGEVNVLLEGTTGVRYLPHESEAAGVVEEATIEAARLRAHGPERGAPHPWTRLRDRFLGDDVERTARRVAACAGWVIVAAESDDVAARIGAGRTMESVWIRAQASRIAVHPMSAALLQSDARRTLGERLGAVGPVQALLRVGRVDDHPGPQTPRRPLADFVRRAR